MVHMDKNTTLMFDSRFKLLLFLSMTYFTINLIGIPMAYKLIAKESTFLEGGFILPP